MTVMMVMNVRTRYNILRVGFVIVLDKAETIHELNLNNVASAMFFKEVLDFLLAGCCRYMSAFWRVIVFFFFIKRALITHHDR